MSFYPYIIAIFDLLGAAAFFIAGAYCLENFERSKFASKRWVSLTGAVFLAAMWATFVSLEWFGVLPEYLDKIQQPIIGVVLILIAVSSLCCLKQRRK